jgi:hypothetical protein
MSESPQFTMVVQVVLPKIPPYRPKYAILLNKTRQEIVAFARTHPKCFVFPFVTGPESECPDYRWLRRKGDPIRQRILMPAYIGHLHPAEKAIEQIVSNALQAPLSECDEVRDE